VTALALIAVETTPSFVAASGAVFFGHVPLARPMLVGSAAVNALEAIAGVTCVVLMWRRDANVTP
jgi:hypothetical protein